MADDAMEREGKAAGGTVAAACRVRVSVSVLVFVFFVSLIVESCVGCVFVSSRIFC